MHPTSRNPNSREAGEESGLPLAASSAPEGDYAGNPRTPPEDRPEKPSSIDGLTLYPASKHVERAGEMIALTPQEYRLLEYLLRRRGAVATRNEIKENTAIGPNECRSKTVDFTLCMLRKKLSRGGSLPELIHTRKRQGYIFEAG